MVGAAIQERGRASAYTTVAFPNPARSGSLRTDLLSGSVSTLRERRDPWVHLARRCAIDPSFHPDALLVFLEIVTSAARIEMVNVSQGDRLIGALPLVREQARMLHVPVRQLRPPGPVDSPDRFDILCAAEDTERVARAAWAALATRDDWDVLELVDLPEGGPGWRMLGLARAAGFGVGGRVSRTTPYIPLDPTLPLETNLPATTAKFRANVRRRRRNLEKLGPVELIRRTSYDDALFTQFLELEHAGWKGRHGTSILSDPTETAFYRRLASVLADNGMLVMYSLECAGVPIAMHFGTAVADRYAVPKLAFNERYHKSAPGQLLIWAVLDDLLRRGFTEFDFLGDAKPWKEEWTDQSRVHHRAHIFNKTIAGRLAKTIRYDVAPRGQLLKERLSRRPAARPRLLWSQEVHRR